MQNIKPRGQFSRNNLRGTKAIVKNNLLLNET